jgi:hypothetical protein
MSILPVSNRFWWTRDALGDGCARAVMQRGAAAAPARLAEMVFAIARPGDFVVCLGRGTSRNGPPYCRRGGNCKAAV